MKALGKLFAGVLGKVNLKGAAADVLEKVALEQVSVSVADGWEELPASERSRLALEVEHLAAAMNSSAVLDAATIDRRIARLQALKAGPAAGGADPASARKVGEAVADLIRELRDGVSE
jgi:hypothetical protein